MLDPALIATLKDLGLGGLAAFALVGGFRGWYVWRREYDALKAERDFYRSIAHKSMGHTDQALEVVATVAKGTRNG